MSGTELLLQLRAEGVDADVIMVTSANDAKTVNDAVRLGRAARQLQLGGAQPYTVSGGHADTACHAAERIAEPDAFAHRGLSAGCTRNTAYQR